MIESFGPWSTAIGTVGTRQLDTFWKKRMAMLPSLNHAASGETRRATVFVAFLTAMALGSPTLQWVAHGNSASTVGVNTAGAGEPAVTGKAAAAADGRENRLAGSNAADAPVRVEFLPRPTEDEEQILKALATAIDIDFRELPFEDCLHFIDDYPNLPKLGLQIDRPTLTDEGVALDYPVTLKLKGHRLESVLKLLLRPLQLEFVIEDDVLMISTSTKIGEKLFTRTYPVRDLYQRPEGDLFHPPQKKVAPDGTSLSDAGFGARGSRIKQEDLVEAIYRTVQPDTWEELSGPGSLTYVQEAGCLVIRQTRAVHAEILQLLRDLRAAKRLPAREAK